MPPLDKDIYQVHKDEGFVAMAVHLGSDVAFARQRTEELGVTFPVVLDIDDSMLVNYVRIGEGVKLFPLSYLIDRKGVIRHIFKIDEPDDDALKAEIEGLLAE